MAAAAAHTMVFRVEFPSSAEAFGSVLSTIAESGGDVRGIRSVLPGRERTTREIEVACDAATGERAVAALGTLDDVTVQSAEVDAVDAHAGGTLTMRNRVSVATRDDLAMAYSPGVARICMAIHDDFEKTWDYTIRGNSVMVVSDGSDVAGVGDLGPLAALPACEAACVVMRQVGGVDGFPLPIDERDLDAAAAHIARSSSVFAGVHLTAMATDRAATLAEKIQALVTIPVATDAQVSQASLAGFWRGVLDARASAVNDTMLAATSNAGTSALDEAAARAVAKGVVDAAMAAGLARVVRTGPPGGSTWPRVRHQVHTRRQRAATVVPDTT